MCNTVGLRAENCTTMMGRKSGFKVHIKQV